MAVDLHTWDTSLPSQFLPEDEDNSILSHSPHNDDNNNNKGSALKPLVHSTEVHRNDKDDDFISELTHHMDRFMLQDDHKFDFSAIDSQNLDLSWDLIGSPQSTLWSPLGSNQGSSEGSSQEPSPPATPGNDQDSCWKNTHEVMRMFDKMKLDERGNSKHHPGYEIHSFKTSQSLNQGHIRAIEFSRLKQEQVLSLKQKQSESQGQISQQSEAKEQIKQSQKKGKGSGNNGRRTRPPRPAFLQSQQQSDAGMRALFLGGSGSTSGTGVFLPRAVTSAPSKSTKKQDVLVSNRDGMYSLQKRESLKAPANIQNEMILPQEWTY